MVPSVTLVLTVCAGVGFADVFLIAGIRLFRREGIASLAFTGAVGRGLMGSG